MKLLVAGLVAAADRRQVHGFDKFEERDLDLLLRPDAQSYRNLQQHAHRTLKEIEQMGYRDKVSLQQDLMDSYIGTYTETRPGINTNIEWRVCQSGWSEQQVVVTWVVWVQRRDALMMLKGSFFARSANLLFTGT